MKRRKSVGSNQDSTLKEAGSMLFFTSIVLLMFLGYPSILNTYNAFQNEFAESYDVPAPIPVYAIIMYEGIPLQWETLGHYWFDQESPQYDFGLFPTANADTVNHRITLNADRIRTVFASGGTHSPNPVTPCEDATASYGGGYPANRRMITQNDETCSMYYHSTNIGEPNPPPDLARYIDDVIWRARGITGQSGNSCDTGALIGVPTSFGGTMTAEQLVDNSTARFSSSTGGCAVARTTFPSLYGSAMGSVGDELYRNLIETGFYPNGDSIDLGIGMWHSAFYPATRGVFSTVVINQNWIEFDLATIPINHTNGLWQLKEHSKFSTGTMDDCEFERLDNAFSINTGDTDSQQGQCVIFKVFHKGNDHFFDNFETGFARTVHDGTLEVWDTSTDATVFDINNVTGKIEVFARDQSGTNADGIRFNHLHEIEEQQWVARVNFTNAVYTAGTQEHRVFFVVSNSLTTNPLSHVDSVSMSWQVETTGVVRFLTGFSNLIDIDDNAVFLNATDQGSAMDFGCFEIARDGREITYSFWTNMACSGTPKDTLTREIEAGLITDPQYFTFMYSDQLSVGTGSIALDIDSVQIWSGLNEVPVTPLGEPNVGASVVVNGTGTGETSWFVDVLDGKHDNTNVFSYPQNGLTAIFETDFSENKFRRNVVDNRDPAIFQTNHRMGLTEHTIDTTTPEFDHIAVRPNYVNGAEDYFTVFVGLDDNSSDGKLQMNITDISVGNLRYDFDQPDVRYFDHVIPPTTASACSQCTPREVQPLEPESDLGFVDTNATENNDGLWDWQEHDNQGASFEACFTDLATGVDPTVLPATTSATRGFEVFEVGTGAGSCGQEAGTFFTIKTFPIEEIRGSDITIEWAGYHFSNPINVFVRDGNYTAGNFTDFPAGAGLPTKGGGILGQLDVLFPTGGLITNSTLSASSIDYDSSTTGFITVLVRVVDSNITFSLGYDIVRVDISRVGEFDFRSVEIDGTNSAGNEQDFGTVNATVAQGAPTLPAPLSPVSNIQTAIVNSVNITWAHDQVNTTGYRIYRTSTESVDEKVLYTFNGVSSPQTQILSETPIDFTVQTTWGTTFVNEIVSRVTMNNVFNSTGASGIVKGAIMLDADNAGSVGDFTIIKNSTTFRDTSVLAIPSDTALTFRFIGTDLINLTSSVTSEGADNIGIGVSWNKARVGDTGTTTFRSADGIGGGAPRMVRSDISIPQWGTTNGQDLKGSIGVVNQTKLLSISIPFVNDTGSLDLNFTDTTTISGNTYFYRIVPLNGDVEGTTIGVVNATQPFIPVTPENFAVVNDNVNREMDISFNSVPFATKYLIERLSTEREIVHFDTTLTDDNLRLTMTQQDDHIGDNVGSLEGEIPTRVSTGLFRKDNAQVGGELERGAWFNLISASSTKEIMDIKAEYSRGSQMIASGLGGGERPARSCVGDSATFRQDGMTPLVGGTYFDGLCRDQAIFRGNQLHNLTSADVVNSVVFGSSWLNNGSSIDLPNGFPASFMSSDSRSGSTSWNWDNVAEKWFTGSGFLEMKVWRLNQTAEPLITLLGNDNTTFTDETILDEESYFFRVTALNDADESVAPTQYLNMTLSQPPEHVPDLNGTVVGGTIELVWDPASLVPSRTDSGDPIKGYHIQVASGANETTIHDGHNRNAVNTVDHPSRNAGTGRLTLGFGEGMGQQLNLTSAENVTRFVARIATTGGATGNVEPTIQGAIWNVTDSSTVALSMHPHINWNGDRIVGTQGRYVNVIFDPPVQLTAGEYVFGFIHNGLTCSGSCGSKPLESGFANQEFIAYYNNTGNGDADGFAVHDRSTSSFPNIQINGTIADFDISIYAEADWSTIGTNLGISNVTFTDTSPPSGTKAYRVLPFNDAGISDPPVLAHDPQQHTINATSKLAEDVLGFSYSTTSQNPPFVDGTLGKLNIGELFTVAVTTEPDAIVDLVADPQGAQCNLAWTLPANGGEPINGHKILVKVDGGSFVTLIANTTNAIATFNHTSLNIGSTYEYDVRALNIKGEATGSNVPMCVPELSSPPDPPTALGLENVGVNVKLEWVAPSQSVDGYKIERKIENGAFAVLVFDTGNTDVIFVDTTIPALGTEVTYRVRSLNFFGESAPSGEATIVSSNPPNKPTLMADQVGSLITLTWTLPTSDGIVNGFKIERQVNFGGFTDLVSNTTNTLLTIDDSAVSKPNTYSYRVSAHDDIPSTGATSNQVDVVFGSHQEVKVREQDGSGYKGFGDVIISNSTFSLTKGIDSQSNVVFSNLASGLYNYTFKDMDDFVLNKTINESFPSALTIETFTINALVFDVDCPATIGSDLRIKMNFTNIQDITTYPSTPVCDSSDKVSWSTTWDTGIGTGSSQMVADFISARFQTNADNFLVSLTPTSTIYSDPLNRIISSSFNITTSSPTTINFDLFLGEAPPSSSSPSSSPSSSSSAGGANIPQLKIIFEDRLTGLTLLSLSHMFIQPNDVIDGTITVGWNGETGMRVNRIDVGEFTDLIRFTTTPPFMLDSITEGAGETARTEADVAYKIFIPQAFCDEDAGILLNCLERELIIIPVTFTFEFQDQEFIGQTEVIIDAREIPIDIVQLQVIALGIVVIFSAFVGNAFRSRFKKKNVRKRKIKKKFDSS